MLAVPSKLSLEESTCGFIRREGDVLVQGHTYEMRVDLKTLRASGKHQDLAGPGDIPASFFATAYALEEGEKYSALMCVQEHHGNICLEMSWEDSEGDTHVAATSAAPDFELELQGKVRRIGDQFRSWIADDIVVAKMDADRAPPASEAHRWAFLVNSIVRCRCTTPGGSPHRKCWDCEGVGYYVPYDDVQTQKFWDPAQVAAVRVAKYVLALVPSAPASLWGLRRVLEPILAGDHNAQWALSAAFEALGEHQQADLADRIKVSWKDLTVRDRRAVWALMRAHEIGFFTLEEAPHVSIDRGVLLDEVGLAYLELFDIRASDVEE